VKFYKILTTIGIILIYIIGAIVIYQILRAIFHGTWAAENILIALGVLNITATITLIGFHMDLRSKFFGHIGYHRGYEKGLRNGKTKAWSK